MLDKPSSFREARHINKIFFLGADERFYEPNYAHYRPSDDFVDLIKAMLEAHGRSWKTHRKDVWTYVTAPPEEIASKLPTQGWKIHVSANVTNCRDILVKVSALALEQGIQFKFANDINTLKLMTTKRWTRGGSGKFITIYPSTDKKFHQFIECAYTLLKNDVGSYVLSDRRYKDCRCLYYRYGTFLAVNRISYLGQNHQVLISPDGEEVLDKRNPFFETPPWVTDPFPSDESDQGEMTLNEGRFSVKSALGFSNTGGVYLATDTSTGKEVVIKEARPYVELGTNCQDATTRLAQEAKILRALEGLGFVPKVYSTFWDWENFYLVEEYFDALDMREVMVLHTPLLRVNPTLADSEEFYDTYKRMFTSLLQAIDQVHVKGVVIGDLSPMNILVEKSTMTVRLIDLEGAFRPLVEAAQDIHTPGFRPKVKGRKPESNRQDDIYAVGAIMMYSMFPIAAMAFLRDDLFTTVLPTVVADIGWSNTPVLHVIQQLVSNAISCREAIELLDVPAMIEQPMARPCAHTALAADACGQMAQFITRNYRLEELYTLFPVDPFGAHTNPAGLGFGSTGIIQSLLKCGFAVPEEALDRYNKEIATVEPTAIAPGLLVGSAGMAWALLGIGDLKSGKRFLQYANNSRLLRAHHSLYYGMAGIGMANLAAYRMLGDRQYLEMATDLAETLAATAVESGKGLHWEDDGGIRIGFGYGQSGVALFFLRLSQVLEVTKWREMGRKALEYDLSFGHQLEPGVTTFGGSPEETQTYEPYIEQGSAGIAKVAIRYGLWDQLDGILADTHRKYSGYPGLIYGLSGLIDVLLDAYLYSQDKKYLEMTERPLQGLTDLYLFQDKDGLATSGENMFRISCDYATGIAGVMRTLHRWAHLQPDEFCLDELDDMAALSRVVPPDALRAT